MGHSLGTFLDTQNLVACCKKTIRALGIQSFWPQMPSWYLMFDGHWTMNGDWTRQVNNPKLRKLRQSSAKNGHNWGIFSTIYWTILIQIRSPFLVGGWPTPLKNMSSLVGMMTFPIYGKIKFLFQTTNQIYTYIIAYTYIYINLITMFHSIIIASLHPNFSHLLSFIIILVGGFNPSEKY